MNVGELKKLLEDEKVPDDVEIFRHGGDHEAFKVYPYFGFVTFTPDFHCWHEDFGEDYEINGMETVRQPALIMGG